MADKKLGSFQYKRSYFNRVLLAMDTETVTVRYTALTFDQPPYAGHLYLDRTVVMPSGALDSASQANARNMPAFWRKELEQDLEVDLDALRAEMGVA